MPARFLPIFVSFAFVACAVSPASARQPAQSFSLIGGEQVYSVAMHQHGSMSEGEGSMEWHADQAHQTSAVDVIWWTDHDWRVAHRVHTNRYDFENATVNLAETQVAEPDNAYGGEFRYWDRLGSLTATYDISIVDSLAFEGSQSLRFKAADSVVDPVFKSVSFAQVSSRKQNMYSLAARVRLKFAVFVEDLSATDARFVVQVRLSEHPTEWHELRYVLGAMEGEGTNATSLPYTVGQWNNYEVDLTADAIAKFTAGGIDSLRAEDNSMFEATIGLEARNGEQPVIFFDDYQILRDESLDGNDLLDKARAIGAYYETTFPSVSHFVGTEISWYRAQPHLNGYAPNVNLVDYTGTIFSDSLYYAVDQIHAQGGCVSLNHAYGPGLYGYPETPSEEAARIRFIKRQLLNTRCWAADILEVGYRIRHGIEIEKFVDTWDTLTGNAIFVTGNGISDSHGSDFFHGWGPWIPGNYNYENNFVTWVHATSLSEAAFVDAFLSGRAYFGDPFAWDGSLDLVTDDGFPMGRVVVTDRASHDVVVQITNASPGMEVRFVQGEIREDPPVEYLDVNLLRDEDLSGSLVSGVFTDTVTVDTTIPSFVRIEVGESGLTSTFSNPLHFLAAPPTLGVPAPRVAAHVGPVRILDATRWTLTGVSYVASPASFTIDGDETTLGAGALTVDPGTLGAPSQVAGATTWSFDGSLLSLSGFSGPASQVVIHWGSVDAPPVAAPVRELALTVRSPNPFVDRLAFEIALPDPSQLFLEVLDVQGRRVRVLADERRPAGVYRETWDGLDPYGRPVAAGVYFVRLSAQGERLGQKVVKLR